MASARLLIVDDDPSLRQFQLGAQELALIRAEPLTRLCWA